MLDHKGDAEMKIFDVNVRDGKGLISIVVQDMIAEERLRSFFNEAYVAFDRLDDLDDIEQVPAIEEMRRLK